MMCVLLVYFLLSSYMCKRIECEMSSQLPLSTAYVSDLKE